MACKGGHFTIGNELPASNFSNPSWSTGRRGNVALFYKTLLADSPLQDVAVRQMAANLFPAGGMRRNPLYCREKITCSQFSLSFAV